MWPPASNVAVLHVGAECRRPTWKPSGWVFSAERSSGPIWLRSSDPIRGRSSDPIQLRSSKPIYNTTESRTKMISKTTNHHLHLLLALGLSPRPQPANSTSSRCRRSPRSSRYLATVTPSAPYFIDDAGFFPPSRPTSSSPRSTFRTHIRHRARVARPLGTTRFDLMTSPTLTLTDNEKARKRSDNPM